METKIMWSDLGQCRLVGAVEGPGLHMFMYKPLGPQDMQGHPLLGWAQMLVNVFVSL